MLWISFWTYLFWKSLYPIWWNSRSYSLFFCHLVRNTNKMWDVQLLTSRLLFVHPQHLVHAFDNGMSKTPHAPNPCHLGRFILVASRLKFRLFKGCSTLGTNGKMVLTLQATNWCCRSKSVKKNFEKGFAKLFIHYCFQELFLDCMSVRRPCRWNLATSKSPKRINWVFLFVHKQFGTGSWIDENVPAI